LKRHKINKKSEEWRVKSEESLGKVKSEESLGME
jgi:hypothetical protein